VAIHIDYRKTESQALLTILQSLAAAETANVTFARFWNRRDFRVFNTIALRADIIGLSRHHPKSTRRRLMHRNRSFLTRSHRRRGQATLTNRDFCSVARQRGGLANAWMLNE
jgi:hypothetical protein